MKVARVVGEVVSTVKHPYLVGWKLLVVQPVNAKDQPIGKPVLALDSAHAGPGERVLVVDEGGAAGAVIGVAGPVRTVIVGRVDTMEVDGSSLEKGS